MPGAVLLTLLMSSRLDLQHFMWKDAAGGRLLHSSIPIEDQNLRVADIGTGTGSDPFNSEVS